MKYSFKKINIEAPFPTTQCGHSCQTEELFDYHDHLYARVLGIDDGNNWLIHISLDVLAFTREYRDEVQKRLRELYNNENLHVITSSTHTHYANSVRTDKYINYLVDLLVKEIPTMEYKEVNNVTTSFEKMHSTAVGKSRISDYETNNETLALVRFFENENNFLNIVYYNCHPTILEANVPYFSAEYPGYVLKKLEENYPGVDFTYVQGAAGDISSRFVRDGQDYEALIKLGDNLVKDANELMTAQNKKVPFAIKYKETNVHYDHEFKPIDLSNIRTDLSPRELKTIEIGQEQRRKLEKKANEIFGTLISDVIVTSVDIGSMKFIFYPNEIFSEYINFIDKERELLVSYSNGYGPYILPIDFKYITYEMFVDTLTKDTKLRIIEAIKNA